MTKTQKGFTLIELLVVIAIIGILAGILFVAINPKKQTDKANDAKIKSTLGQVLTAAALADATTFAGVCDNTTDQGKAVEALTDSITGAVCTAGANGNTFTVVAPLNDTTDKACVDQNGLTVSAGAPATAGVSCK